MTREDHLTDQLAALDAFATRDDAALAGATRLRVRASLERGHAWRRHAGVLAALAVLLVASASWALATGRLKRWLAPPSPQHTSAAAPAVANTPRVAAPEPPAVIAASPPAVIAASPPAVASAPEAPAALQPAVAPNRATVRTPVHTDTMDDTLYARAHELHFHGDDPAAALAAWNAYLEAEPHGAFAVEAHYNRALCLVRLGRLADARRELEPFAHGDVEPRGYRQSDASHLIERIDRRTGNNALNGLP